MSYSKIPAKIEERSLFYITGKVKFHKNTSEQYELSFNAPLNLVAIHPWVGGNRRMVRLLMN